MYHLSFLTLFSDDLRKTRIHCKYMAIKEIFYDYLECLYIALINRLIMHKYHRHR